MDGQKIFVSTVGDDSGDGSEEEPLRTLEKAIILRNSCVGKKPFHLMWKGFLFLGIFYDSLSAEIYINSIN